MRCRPHLARTTLASISMLCLLILLSGCGQETASSGYVPIRDRVTTSASIQFVAESRQIKVNSRGLDAASQTIPICKFSLDSIADTLDYQLVDQDHLQMGQGQFTYKRALTPSQTFNGVPDRLFSVWATDREIKEGVSLDLELSIEPQTLSFTLICSQ